MRSLGNRRPRFAADGMLGSLAKWLRITGYDASYARDEKDDDILMKARAEGRVLLTRDKLLAQKAGDDGVFVDSEVIDEQIRQVFGLFHLHFDEKGTRCALCNGDLVVVPKEEVSPLVPPRSLAMTDDFLRCSGCGKIYWKGTHWKNILEKLKRLGIDQDRSFE
ncbi:MAG: Mut7-C RNAse domain-containing protein [Euryarchaeota archaeon]|nr:Mut7-C RNAse domain-containing protein [Euryarchaeota archaeon]